MILNYAQLARISGMTHEVAAIIQDQIGRKAFFMLGAKDLVSTEKSLRFKIGRNAKSVSHVEVTLDPSDTYTVRFIRLRAGKTTVIADVSDVYVDSLHSVIEQHTGMYTSL